MLVSCSLACNGNYVFCLQGFQPLQQKHSSLSSLAQLAKKARSIHYLIANKKKPISGLLFISGRRGSNSRHPPWQGGILPLNYPRVFALLFYITCSKKKCNTFYKISFIILYALRTPSSDADDNSDSIRAINSVFSHK